MVFIFVEIVSNMIIFASLPTNPIFHYFFTIFMSKATWQCYAAFDSPS